MNWDSLFEMLKGVFANDPTMILLLTLGFFFLKQIWPQPAPASEQVITGFAARIRKALELGDVDAAKRLSDEGIAQTAALLAEEATPKAKGLLDIFTTIFSNNTMMPLLLIGGVFLLLMISGGGGCGGTGGCSKASADALPASQSWYQGVPRDAIRPAVLYDLDSRAGYVRPIAWEPGLSVGADAWAWANGESAIAGPADRRGSATEDAGTGGPADFARVSPVGDVELQTTACAAGVCRWSGRPAVNRPRAVAAPLSGRWYPGCRIVRAARRAAGALGRLRLPGRPLARLFGRG